MNEFLFELGTEEIPADMIFPATDQLKQVFEGVMRENDLSFKDVLTYSTPRRLTAVVKGLPKKQPDREELITGPPRSVAMNLDGTASTAALGFARKFGVSADQTEVVETERGEYLAIRRRIEGKPTPVILGHALPGIIASLNWPKNMYWRESRFRFIRPLRWFVALWNQEVVPFEFEGVRSQRITFGHRLLSEGPVSIAAVGDYASTLREEHVIVSPAERKARIMSGLTRESGEFKQVPDDGLLEMVVNLNEFPTVIRGRFNPDFLQIPREVLVTVMRFHQKYFSLAKDDGSLAPYFLTVINTEGDADGRIGRGHEKVLQARLEDASFFWTNDQKRSLLDRRDELAHVLFQEKLGSYLQKSERIQMICKHLADDDELAEAASLCKADLTTEMVREFPELQGVMGGLYARQEGLADGVWQAIYEHYQPVTLEDSLPRSRTGVLLSVADRLDTIVGCFGIGLAPSGSRDPFALRRQAQGLIALLLENRLDLDLRQLIEKAQENFSSDLPAAAVSAQVFSFFKQRAQFLFQRKGLPLDSIRAALLSGLGSVPNAWERAWALDEIKGEPDFEALAIAFKRTRNILEGAPDNLVLREDLLIEEGEKALHRAIQELKPQAGVLLQKQDYRAALRKLAGIREVVDQFFDSVLVMAEEEELRLNRLALLSEIAGLFLSVGDISEIIQQGGSNG